MKYRIIGDTGQTVAVELFAGEAIFGFLGTLLFVKGAVKSDTAPSGPYWATISETLTSPDGTPIVVYRCEAGGGLVGFRIPGPGRIHHLGFDGASRIIVKRESIVAATEGITCDRLHLEGEDSGDVPSRAGPRNCGQSAAPTAQTPTRTIRNTTAILPDDRMRERPQNESASADSPPRVRTDAFPAYASCGPTSRHAGG